MCQLRIDANNFPAINAITEAVKLLRAGGRFDQRHRPLLVNCNRPHNPVGEARRILCTGNSYREDGNCHQCGDLLDQHAWLSPSSTGRRYGDHG